MKDFRKSWLVQLHPKLGSSIDSQKTALTVKGALLTLIPIVVMVAGGFGVTLDPDLLVQSLNTILLIITSVTTLIGLIRKIINSF